MRRDELYLRDIIEAAHNIAEDIAGMGREDFLGNRTVRDAVVRNLTVIGEACARISPPFRERLRRDSMAGCHRLPQYPGSRLLRHRLEHCLGSGVAPGPSTC